MGSVALRDCVKVGNDMKEIRTLVMLLAICALPGCVNKAGVRQEMTDLESSNAPHIVSPTTGFDCTWSTYLGGDGIEFGSGIAVDSAFAIYVCGWTSSGNFPTTGSYQPSYNGVSEDGFMAKFDSAGSTLLWSTYIGGTGRDEVFRIVPGKETDDIFVTGNTQSEDFPTISSYQPKKLGDWDAFVMRVSPDCSTLLWSTYLGGNAADWAYKGDVDTDGCFYAIGKTGSTDWPLVNPHESVPGNGFVTKLSSTGSSLGWSTYFGGIGVGEMVSVRDTRAVVCGDGGTIAKMSSSGSSLEWSVVYEGLWLRACYQDMRGDVYAVGYTSNPDLPTVSPYQSFAQRQDVFYLKLTSDGSALLFSSYLGGAGMDYCKDLSVDNDGNMMLAGHTNSSDFPTMEPVQSSLGGYPFDAWIAKISSTGSDLSFSTYLGGSGKDEQYGCAVDFMGNLYISGQTSSVDFPTRNPYQSYKRGPSDSFFAKYTIFSLPRVAQ